VPHCCLQVADAERLERAATCLHTSLAWRRLLHHLLAAGNTINAHRYALSTKPYI
jgi:hypothetical protein